MHNQDHVGAVELTPLLATKLYLPRPRAQLVRRHRLLARLEAGLRGSLTLIAAPAGFGKTTLLADWFNQRPGAGYHVAWLALDASDSDPIQFLRYVVATLQTLEPATGASMLPLLQLTQPPPLTRLMPMLVHDLAQLPNNSVLVLDDYHVVDESSVHEAIGFVVDHLPPQLHVVISSRIDPPLPLARWRVRGQLTELRARDLRFTTDEAVAFMREVMDVQLTVEDVTTLEARTEGWIAGLQLAALSMQERPDAQVSAFIASFTGSHRFVVDYLVDEVLARQPAHVQCFMIETSILDRLCGPLCDAVLGTASGSSQTLLEHLERANLFVVPLDDERRWYRFHHLYAQVLRERLATRSDVEIVGSLHRRASTWLEEHGLLVEAVQHALASQDWERTARLIELHGRSLVVKGQVQMVRDWLKVLPRTTVQNHPYVYLIEALGLFFGNELEAAEDLLATAEEHVAVDAMDDRSRSVRGYATILHASIARFRGDFDRCVTLASQGLALLPPTDVSGRMAASVHVAEAYLQDGNVMPVREQVLANLIASARATGELTNLLYAHVALAVLQRRQGRLRDAAATYHDAALILPTESGLQELPNGANYFFGFGELLHEWNTIADAEIMLTQGREMIRRRQLAQADSVVQGYTTLACLQQTRGDVDTALATLSELQQVAHESRFAPELLAQMRSTETRMALLRGDLPFAVRWAELSTLSVDDDVCFPREQEYLTLARVRIARSRQDPMPPALGDVLHLLDRLLSAAMSSGRLNSAIEILILRALAQQAHGEPDAALRSLERALSQAAPEGYVRLFVDEGAPMAALLTRALRRGSLTPATEEYVATLLDVLEAEEVEGFDEASTGAAGSGARTSTDEPLTERELEVLRLLAAGRSNQVIANELIVAVGTVKRHVSNIMGKLQATSRLEAVARGRERGLL